MFLKEYTLASSAIYLGQRRCIKREVLHSSFPWNITRPLIPMFPMCADSWCWPEANLLYLLFYFQCLFLGNTLLPLLRANHPIIKETDAVLQNEKLWWSRGCRQRGTYLLLGLYGHEKRSRQHNHKGHKNLQGPL